MVPDLRVEGLRKCGLYVDCHTNDSRLTLANVRDAADAGTTVVNYAEVAALRIERGRVKGAEVLVDGRAVSVRARAVVNAAGPWLDSLRRMDDPWPANRSGSAKAFTCSLDAATTGRRRSLSPTTRCV